MEYFLVTVKLSCSNNVFPSIATHVLSFWDQVCARESLMRAPRPRTHSCRSRAATWLNQVSGIRCAPGIADEGAPPSDAFLPLTSGHTADTCSLAA